MASDLGAIAGAGGLAAMMGMMAGVGIIVALAGYVYSALVWQTIAKKLKYDKPWLAWIPIANAFLLPILAKKHWAWGFIFFVPVVNVVFMIIWMWKIFEARKYPGWLALIPIASFIPILNYIAGVAMLVIMGLVAWVDRK